jgi:hypothetical protein
MRIVAELVPRRAEQAVELRSGATGLDLLRSMILPDPRERITAAAALSHPWFFS